MTPYAVQFLGRRIATGRMDLDLGYVLDDGRLDASNHIVLRDLKLGERFEHPDATDLPLGLAIALLKDSDGVITVDIPVQGNVNYPEFSFGPAIRQALTDILQGIISSPFNLLASLVDGDPDELAKVAFTTAEEDEAPEFDAAAYREHLATEVTAAQTVTEEDLEALAQARTDAVRTFILGEGDTPVIEPDRLRSMAPIEVEANGEVVLEIGLAAD